MLYKKVDTTLNFVEREKEVEDFWKSHGIAQKAIDQRAGKENFTFYDGPPTANGKPHIGHVLTRVIKDMLPRYQSMKGKRVLRKAGWDTHGLPVELEVEKALGLDGKDQIEKYGMKISDMLNMYGTSVQDFRTQMETQGEEYGKQYFVIQKIAADQGIKLNDDLINKVAENATKITGKEYNKDKLIEEFGKETIESEAVTMAVLDYIESKVKTTVQEETSEVPESSTAAPAESSTAAK